MSAEVWVRHDLDGGRCFVWLETPPMTRAVALNREGVHPRLNPTDHFERPVLGSLAECEAYWNRCGIDDAAVDVLIVASALLVHLRRGLLTVDEEPAHGHA